MRDYSSTKWLDEIHAEGVEVKKSCCYFCHQNCGVLAYAKDGKLSYYPDYAASNLTDAVPAKLQELVNGTKKPADVLKNIHEKYDTGVEDMGVKNN